jgi:UDP-galactose transporter B1
MIVIGVGVFIFKDDPHRKKSASENTILGTFFIVISLFFDGCLGGAQDKMRSVKRPSPLNFMQYVNIWSTVFVIPLLFINYEGYEFFKFCIRNPDVLYDLAIVIVTATIGQFFISAMIAEFGSLPLALVTTTRKFFTVLFSTFVNGNVLSVQQWIATIIIFVALLLDSLFGKKKIGDNKVGIQSDLEPGKQNISNGEINLDTNDNDVIKTPL